jgi:hypothetical protein
MLVATEQVNDRGVRELEPRGPLDGVGNLMRDASSTTDDSKAAGASSLRLRLGVFLILLWILPFWLLAPEVAHLLSGGTGQPSVATVTTAFVVVQTILGLIGMVVAGTQVKSIVKGSTRRHAIAAIWSIFIHGEIRGQSDAGQEPNDARSPKEDA